MQTTDPRNSGYEKHYDAVHKIMCVSSHFIVLKKAINMSDPVKIEISIVLIHKKIK